MIHPRRPAVGRHLRERRPQCGFGVDLVNQALPFAAFDPRLEGRQHPRCPHPRFDPRPFLVRRRHLAGLSATYSPLGHCYRAESAGSGHRVSIFLHPFAPPALLGFIATLLIPEEVGH
jgi:hypothetical protein